MKVSEVSVQDFVEYGRLDDPTEIELKELERLR